jgi:hypothetical protein
VTGTGTTSLTGPTVVTTGTIRTVMTASGSAPNPGTTIGFVGSGVPAPTITTQNFSAGFVNTVAFATQGSGMVTASLGPAGSALIA